MSIQSRFFSNTAHTLAVSSTQNTFFMKHTAIPMEAFLNARNYRIFHGSLNRVTIVAINLEWSLLPPWQILIYHYIRRVAAFQNSLKIQKGRSHVSYCCDCLLRSLLDLLQDIYRPNPPRVVIVMI